MSEKTYQKTKKPVEMDETSKAIRKTLMDLAPTVNVSKNDLFNRGYGSFISVIMVVGFCVTFLYYAITNSIYNNTAQFLVPDGNQIKGAMNCNPVPVALSNSYAMDSYGTWESSVSFKIGSSLYGLDLINAQYSTKNYTSQMNSFADDLYSKSTDNTDYAWNIVFGGSYAVTAEAGSDGKSTFYVDADSRHMYNAPIFASSISSINGSCIPSTGGYTYDFSYDGTNFNLDITMPTDGHICPKLSMNNELEIGLGLYNTNPIPDQNLNVRSTSISIDAASITTAIAINYKIASLNSLDTVESLKDNFLTAYIDSSYAPMEPIYCFKVPDKYKQYGLDDICLIKVGEMYAYPITSHTGDFAGNFLPDACDCSLKGTQNQSMCSDYDIMVGLLFVIPAQFHLNTSGSYYDYYYGSDATAQVTILDQIIAIQELIYLTGQSINDYLRPLLVSSTIASYYVQDNVLTSQEASDTLFESFNDACPNCALFSFELYDVSRPSTGITINDGGRVLQDMSCSRVFYNESVLNTMAATAPARISEPYLVCTDTIGTAISTGISNAYASGGLYTSVLLFIIMCIINWYHNPHHPDTPLNSTEVQEVIVRNAIFDVLKSLLENSSIPEDEKEQLYNSLNEISITDPLTHAERPHKTVGKFVALVSSPGSSQRKTPNMESSAEMVPVDETGYVSAI